MSENERRRINVEEVLEEASLTLTIGGKEYVVTDIPLPVRMKYSTLANADEFEFVCDILRPLGATDEDLEAMKQGTRRLNAVFLALLDFFVSNASLMEKMKLSPWVAQLYQTGLERLATSLPPTQATE